MTEAEILRILARRPRPALVSRRISLTRKQRLDVLKKTAGTCHVCGVNLGARWHADHVVPHLHGGQTTVQNCLPICVMCNRLRWSYPPDGCRWSYGWAYSRSTRFDTRRHWGGSCLHSLFAGSTKTGADATFARDRRMTN